MPKKRNAYWVFTFNLSRYTLDEFLEGGLPDFELFADSVQYAIYQLEIGEEGNVHYQGYVELKVGHSKTLKGMRKLLPGAHLEIRRGTQAEAIAYCSKEDSRIEGPFTYGTPRPGQGSRSDLLAVKALLDLDTNDKQIADEHFGSWVRYHKSFDEYRALSKPPVDTTPYSLADFNWPPLSLDRSCFLYGPPGTGKTSFALAHFRTPLKVNDIDDLLTFRPGFHDGIVFDDFSLRPLQPETAVHLVDTECRQTLRCRYHNVTLPEKTPRIFIHNEEYALKPKGLTPYQEQAILRRVNLYPVTETLFTE